jgi:hypothetical protein
MKSLVALILLITSNSYAQPPAKEISFYLHGGFYSENFMRLAVFRKMMSESNTHAHVCPVLNTGFQITLPGKWRVGPAFSYDHFGLHDRAIEYSILGYSIKGDKTWYETQRLGFYSGISLGVRTMKHFQNNILVGKNVKPCYQICLAGAEFKIWDFSFDVNLGYGNAGILNGGMRYRF